MRIIKYKSTESTETDNIQNNTPFKVGDVYLSEDQGLYRLDVFPDTGWFRLYFPDGEFVGYENSILNLTNETNPFTEYEDGKVLQWMRSVVFPKENNYEPGWQESIFGLQKPIATSDRIVMEQYTFITDDGMFVQFEISVGGMISILIPERRLIGSIDQIKDQMPELGFLWGGELLRKVKNEFHTVTGISLGE